MQTKIVEQADPTQVILDAKALATREGVKLNTVRVWEMKGVAPKSFRPGGGRLVRYRLSDVIEWEQSHMNATA
ncbi:AlpA family transcriptional regulator [Rothia sp. ZJ932]|uniref:helix-turn-helix transcriptional regulator n=1 Tax=Rothia sp. ZJ932 TaxID=2810516 RepID=UPI0019677CA8|nr:DNA-binding protein [Rothia sp. ZJ932]QRZ61130.1 DNA-binding protein [Rothia sp. ZJ932]